MAKKESQHLELVDGLNNELEKLRKQHEDLIALSRDQVSRLFITRDKALTLY
jgi:kinesin family protein 4/21/27